MVSVSVDTGYKRNTFSLGMTVALASWTMVFITLLWGYVVYRMRVGVWLEPYMSREIMALAILNTLLLGVSSIVLRRGKVLLSFVLGLTFLLGQWMIWKLAFNDGLAWNKSTAGSFFYLLSGFHALHIIGGLVALMVFWVRFDVLKGTSTAVGIRYFWDFLMVVWLVMFTLMFIVR